MSVTASKSAPDADVEPTLAELASRLEPRLDDIVAEMAERIHPRVPEFEPPIHVTGQSRAAIRAAIAGYLTVLKRQAAPGDWNASQESLRFSRAFVERGIKLQALLRIYRLGHGEMWQMMDREIRALEDGEGRRLDLLERMTLTLFEYMDSLTAQAVDAYIEAREEGKHNVAAMRARTVRSILDGEPVDAMAASRVLRYELRRWHVGALLWIDPARLPNDSPNALESAAADLADGAQALSLPAGRNVRWLWLGGTAKALRETLDRLAASGPRADRVSVAIGEPGEGITGFRQTYEEAARVRQLMRGSRWMGAITRYRSVAVQALLVSEPAAAADFARRELGPLAADDDAASRLRATLYAYFQEWGSAVRTARRLAIHQNTVVYRIKQCEEMLGHPIKDRRMELESALLLAQAVDLGVGGEHAADAGGDTQTTRAAL
jgi:DNA-binding PucR family transcriptional regulator